MNNRIKLILTLFILGTVLLWATACGAGGQAANQQQVKVTRGDLTLNASGNGKVEAPREARLTFGSGGKVNRIMVKEGDRVTRGQVLALLDTKPLELARIQAQVALTQADLGVTQADLAVQTAAMNLKTTRESVDALKLAVLNAQISLDTANDNLVETYKTYDWDTFQVIESELNKAKTYYDYALDGLIHAGSSTINWELTLERAREQLNTAQANYNNFVAGRSSDKISLKKGQVEAAKLTLAQANKNLNDLPANITLQELQVTSANKTLEQTRQSVILAQRSVDEAQRQLDEATITASFDGMVATVGAKEGDTITPPSLAPKTIIQLIDPDYLELVAEIDELDIPLVKLGQEATISLDALPDTPFKGTVTAVYPVPKEVAGVVLYDVRLSLNTSADSGIKVGMSATADIMIKKSPDALIIPSRAVGKDAQGNSIVRVMNGDQVQERPVVTGLDDGLRTEIVSGLNEGETVIVEGRAKTAASGSIFG